MPQFGHQDGFDTVVYITGPAHVFLGIRFGKGPFQLKRRSAVAGCDHGALDEMRIINAINKGIAKANVETGVELSAAAAFYVEGDSPRYDLFEECAYRLALRRSQPN